MTPTTSEEEASFLEDPYYREVQTDIWNSQRRRARNCLFYVALIFLVPDLLALVRLGSVTPVIVLYVLAMPLLFLALAFIALRHPVVAISTGAIIFLAVIALNAYLQGAENLVSGLIAKALVVYFFVSGYRSAREAEEARENLSSLG
jgi:heme O synthase-like polyprenyltransferase